MCVLPPRVVILCKYYEIVLVVNAMKSNEIVMKSEVHRTIVMKSEVHLRWPHRTSNSAEHEELADNVPLNDESVPIIKSCSARRCRCRSARYAVGAQPVVRLTAVVLDVSKHECVALAVS